MQFWGQTAQVPDCASLDPRTFRGEPQRLGGSTKSLAHSAESDHGPRERPGRNARSTYQPLLAQPSSHVICFVSDIASRM